MSAPDIGRLKELFGEVCDLPTREAALARLGELGASPAESAGVLELLVHDDGHTTHLSAPVRNMMAGVASGELQPGDRLGAWLLIRALGEGGMGRVFEAARNDGHYQQTAAIKVLRGLPHEAALTALARERQILAELNHRHIARLLDGGSTPAGNPYIVMEYVAGARIDEHVRTHHLRPPQLLPLFLMVCEAVAYAHQRLIVHCDIKPGNVLVDEQGEVKLLDFGIAQLEGRDDLGLQAMTPRYASPEQRAGERASAATDIYSLGRLLEVLLAATPGRLDRATEWQAIVACACAEQPDQRYADVGQLIADLRRLASHQPLMALRTAGPTGPMPWASCCADAGPGPPSVWPWRLFLSHSPGASSKSATAR